ncbi:MAG: peptidoglycan-associated lipoprotein Pal [Deltaproteobacteria bacterium]|nr:peptidoglycan-associated lipoprotein Pal [Deltaproteobacteria bacterium]
MVDRLTASLYGLMFFAFLGLSGCPPPATTTKPDVSSLPSQRAAREQSPGTVRESSMPSSLEALRRGETPTTAALSPVKEIYYDYDQYNLRPDARETLRTNADWLKANPSARVEIEGHCDERGTNEYNLALGAKRAQAAKDYLITLGIFEGRLTTISYGEELAVCKEQTEQCWQNNRRGRLVIITTGPAS